jgi:hypothetical protein
MMFEKQNFHFKVNIFHDLCATGNLTEIGKVQVESIKMEFPVIFIISVLTEFAETGNNRRGATLHVPPPSFLHPFTRGSRFSCAAVSR